MRTDRLLVTLVAALPASGLSAQPVETSATETSAEETFAQTPMIGPVADGTSVILPVGMRIDLQTTEEITSKRVRKGDLVRLTTKDDLLFEGTLIVPAGTIGIAEITEAEKKGMMGRGGKLSARMLYLEMDGGPVRISGELASVGKDQTALATAALGATMGFGFFVTGKTAVIPAGTDLIVEINREARFSGVLQP